MLKKNSVLPNETVFQHNFLVRHPICMGRVEAKIFIYALSLIKQGENGHTELPEIEIPVAEILTSNDSKTAYEAINKACRDLYNKSLVLLKPNQKGFSETRIVSKLSHVDGTHVIKGTFAPDIAPYLLQLTKNGNFTSAEIETLLTFKSPNSQRLYWILKSWSGLKSMKSFVVREESIEELKKQMFVNTDIYPVYAEFKRNVLDSIAEDFQKIGYDATWSPIKTGKKVTGLKFSIPKQVEKKVVQKELFPQEDGFNGWLLTQRPQVEVAYKGMISADKITQVVARKIVKYVAGNEVKERVLFKARYDVQQNIDAILKKGSTRAAYICNAIKNIGLEF